MFVDANSQVDREGLRSYIFSQLTQLHHQSIVLCQEKNHFWQQLHHEAKQSLRPHEREKAIRVINQLELLPGYISHWINLAVDTSERFEFFIAVKANELHSGDQQRDYFWALQIRHDQLVALVRVLELLLHHMARWVTKRPEAVFDDPVFSGLTAFGIEDQIYLEAEKVYKERTQVMQR